MLLLTPVSCPLPGRGEGAPKLSGSDRVLVREESRLREILGVAEIDQEYFCNYEPNPAYRDLVDSGGLRICAETARGEVRAAERPKHPFFIGVLFQPQRTSRPGSPHPLIAAFVHAAGGFQHASRTSPEAG
jgi:CTP synthase (UTP-ammonia lyase)